MSIYNSNRSFQGFFDDSGSRNYEKYRSNENAEYVFEWLKARIDWLISSIRNHRKPALQGVIVDLTNDVLIGRFGWSKDNKDNFFITMIGAMVRYLVEEHGFEVVRSGVPLRHSDIIGTAATYRPVIR